MTKYKNRNYQGLVRPNEDIQVLTIVDPDATFKKHYPLGTIVSFYDGADWWLCTLAQEVGASDTFRNVAKYEFSIGYIDNRPLGEELVLNGLFLTDLSDWTVDVSGDGDISWEAESEVFAYCGAPLNSFAMWQSQDLEVGANYRLDIEVGEVGDGGFKVDIAGAPSFYIAAGDPTRVETYYFTAVNGNDLYIQSNGESSGYIFTVSLKKLI